jgi:RNA polymerase sigma-70 factor (ECF subfamily)
VKSNAVNASAELAGTSATDKAVSGSNSASYLLMQRLHAGDEAAMQSLIETHGGMLAGMIGRLTGWHADRDDILQDVLLKVWQNAGEYKGVGALEGWLRSIAVNRCRNYFRSINSIKRLIKRFVSLGVAVSVDSEDLAETEDAKKQLQAALQRLPQADRTVLVLFYLEEMPGEEIARMLNIKQETLHVRLHRARKKLKLVIGDNRDTFL